MFFTWQKCNLLTTNILYMYIYIYMCVYVLCICQAEWSLATLCWAFWARLIRSSKNVCCCWFLWSNRTSHCSLSLGRGGGRKLQNLYSTVRYKSLSIVSYGVYILYVNSILLQITKTKIFNISFLWFYFTFCAV